MDVHRLITEEQSISLLVIKMANGICNGTTSFVLNFSRSQGLSLKPHDVRGQAALDLSESVTIPSLEKVVYHTVPENAVMPGKQPTGGEVLD